MLLRLTAEGDAGAFTELYDQHSGLVFSIALRILEDREEAKDVVQQVFLKMLMKAGLYSPDKGRPAAWLGTMTRNQSLDRLRYLKGQRLLGEKLCLEGHGAGTPDQRGGRFAQYEDELVELHGAIAALRPEESQVLHLAYFNGLSQTEIAIRLGQPLGSIKARIRRALIKLRVSLGTLLNPDAEPGGRCRERNWSQNNGSHGFSEVGVHPISAYYVTLILMNLLSGM